MKTKQATMYLINQVRQMNQLQLEIKENEKILKEIKANVSVYMRASDAKILLDGNRKILTIIKRKGALRLNTKKLKEDRPDIYKDFLQQGSDIEIFKLEEGDL